MRDGSITHTYIVSLRVQCSFSSATNYLPSSHQSQGIINDPHIINLGRYCRSDIRRSDISLAIITIAGSTLISTFHRSLVRDIDPVSIYKRIARRLDRDNRDNFAFDVCTYNRSVCAYLRPHRAPVQLIGRSLRGTDAFAATTRLFSENQLDVARLAVSTD